MSHVPLHYKAEVISTTTFYISLIIWWRFKHPEYWVDCFFDVRFSLKNFHRARSQCCGSIWAESGPAQVLSCSVAWLEQYSWIPVGGKGDRCDDDDDDDMGFQEKFVLFVWSFYSLSPASPSDSSATETIFNSATLITCSRWILIRMSLFRFRRLLPI